MSDSRTSERAISQDVTIRHTRVATDLSYDALVRAFERELRYLDPVTIQDLVEQRAAWSAIECKIGDVGGTHGLMIIAHSDLGKIASLSGHERRCSLYLVGNPIIANQIIRIDLRASFYVPFRVALYEEENDRGAVMSYDRPSSFLATLGRPELAEIAVSLDRKIDGVAAAVCAG